MFRDDVADHKKWADRFKCTRILHSEDVCLWIYPTSLAKLSHILDRLQHLDPCRDTILLLNPALMTLKGSLLGWTFDHWYGVKAGRKWTMEPLWRYWAYSHSWSYQSKSCPLARAYMKMKCSFFVKKNFTMIFDYKISALYKITGISVLVP